MPRGACRTGTICEQEPTRPKTQVKRLTGGVAGSSPAEEVVGEGTKPGDPDAAHRLARPNVLPGRRRAAAWSTPSCSTRIATCFSRLLSPLAAP